MGLKLLEVLEVAAVASAYWPLSVARGALCGTTLGGAYRWALLALAGWVVVAGAEAGGATAWTVGHLRYAAAALSVCPMMAVLGARQPGLAAWHFVVLVLFVVLLVPLLQALLRGRGERPLRADDVWTLLFAGVSLAGVVNYVATRLAPGACAIGVFLVAVVASAGPWDSVREWGTVRWGARLAPLGVAAGTWLGWCNWRLRKRNLRPQSWNRVWLDYRERFGLIWSRRVQERFNASAEQLKWPVRLSWRGFVTAGEEDQTMEPAVSLLVASDPMQTALRSLLRRFVSDEWLAARLEVPRQPENG